MAKDRSHTLTVKVSYPERTGACDKVTIELSFRLPQWALAKLNQMDGVAVTASRQNHILFVLTPAWSGFRQEVLTLIANANSNALVEKTSGGSMGYSVRIEEQVLAIRATELTPTAPLL